MRDPLEDIIEELKESPKKFISMIISSALMMLGIYAFMLLLIIIL